MQLIYTFCKIQNKLQNILCILIIIFQEFLVYIQRCCLYIKRDNSYSLRNEVSNKNVWFYLNCKNNYLFSWTKSCYIVIYFIYLYFAIFQINSNTYTSNMDHHRWINSKFLIIGFIHNSYQFRTYDKSSQNAWLHLKNLFPETKLCYIVTYLY